MCRYMCELLILSYCLPQAPSSMQTEHGFGKSKASNLFNSFTVSFITLTQTSVPEQVVPRRMHRLLLAKEATLCCKSSLAVESSCPRKNLAVSCKSSFLGIAGLFRASASFETGSLNVRFLNLGFSSRHGNLTEGSSQSNSLSGHFQIILVFGHAVYLGCSIHAFAFPIENLHL